MHLISRIEKNKKNSLQLEKFPSFDGSVLNRLFMQKTLCTTCVQDCVFWLCLHYSKKQW